MLCAWLEAPAITGLGALEAELRPDMGFARGLVETAVARREP